MPEEQKRNLKRNFLTAYDLTEGHIGQAARVLELTPQAIAYHRNKDAVFDIACKEIEKRYTDPDRPWLGPRGRRAAKRGRKSTGNGEWTERIADLKEAARVSYREMAHAAGIDGRTAQKWCGKLGGMKCLPDAGKLRALLQFLHAKSRQGAAPAMIAAAVELSCSEILKDAGYLHKEAMPALTTATMSY